MRTVRLVNAVVGVTAVAFVVGAIAQADPGTETGVVIATAPVSTLPPPAHGPGPESLEEAGTTTTTTTTTTAPRRTTTTRPPRADRSQRTSTPTTARPAPPVSVAAGDCGGGWRGMTTEARRARAHACWDDLIAKYFPNEQAKAFSVMWCESKGDPNAVGPRQPDGSYPHGLMQILRGPFDPDANMALAASMRADRGWQPWACA